MPIVVDRPLMSPQKASDLMAESGILDRIKVDNFLLVLAGARPCSQTTLPAEMPGGGGMGSTIDNMVAPRMGALRSERDPHRKMAAIASLKKEMARAYERVVMDSPQYRAHQRWVRALGLRSRYADGLPAIGAVHCSRRRRRDLPLIICQQYSSSCMMYSCVKRLVPHERHLS